MCPCGAYSFCKGMAMVGTAQDIVTLVYAAKADPDAADKNFLECLNPDSLEILTGCKVEPSMADAAAPASFQFMRLGYFCLDSKDSRPDHLVFNRSVSLKDSFKK